MTSSWRALAAVALALFAVQGTAKSFDDPYQAYAAGVYDQALQGFVDRQVERPDDPRLAINLGNTYYKMKDYEAAAQAFAPVATSPDPSLKEQALYSLGNVAFRQGRLEEAVTLYQAALEVAPDDGDAKYNLELARDEIRRRQEEAQKRQQQQKQNQKQGQQSQRQDQQQQDPSQQDPAQQDQQPGEQEKQGRQEKQEAAEPQAGTEPGQEQQTEAQAAQAGGKPGEMSRETAERLLAALEEGRPLPKRQAKGARSIRAGKDW